jgi:glycolate oxidase FAD binding subunit
VANVDEKSCCIDDFGPLPVVQPQSVGDLRELVHRAVSENQALYPIGGQTLLNVGLPPVRPGTAVDLRALSQVIDYPARDMTVTVQAGITVARLQSLLATENQRLPIDVPRAEQATLGGILAVNVSGPRRLGFGTLRDYVIGISTVNDEGQEVKAGGRVVKNVAGYDLCKLHVGALGTLGIISQVTLKLRPLPESKALVAFGCESEALDRVLEDVHTTRTRPVCLDLLNQAVVRSFGLNLPEASWVIVAGFEDNREAVGWQVRQLLTELTSISCQVRPLMAEPALTGIRGLEVWADGAIDPLWQALVESPVKDGRLSFKANLLPHAVAEFCQQAAAFSEAIHLHAHAGSGIVYGALDGDLTLPRVAAMLKELTDAAVRAEGNLVVPRCPVEWKRELPVWGRERGDLWLMRQVKDKLDPRHLFNPGRFIAGI